MDTFLASIMLWPCNFAPLGWHFCDGTLLSISQNSALFALLGTTFGGDGVTTFALPDFRGRVPVGAGQGLNLSNYIIGQFSGTENITLSVNQMPAHAHTVTLTVSASNAQATDSTPTASVHTLAAPYDTNNSNPIAGYNNAAPNTPLNIGSGANGSTGMAGGSQPAPIMQPYLVVNYIIAMQGIFPSRN